MIKFEKIKPGMVLYDVRRSSGIRAMVRGNKWDVWNVYVKEVSSIRREVYASWNGNKYQWIGEPEIAKFRAAVPKEK